MCERECFVRGHRSALESLTQRLPAQEFHRDEVATFVAADLVDLADIGVIDRGRGLRLTEEAPLRGKVAPLVLGQKLERNRTAQHGVLGEKDIAHAPGTDRSDNTVPVHGSDYTAIEQGRQSGIFYTP